MGNITCIIIRKKSIEKMIRRRVIPLTGELAETKMVKLDGKQTDENKL